MTSVHWRDWHLSSRDGAWLCARRRVDGVLHTVMVRPRRLGGFRAAIFRATWPVESRGIGDAETATAALDAAARAAGMVLR